MAPVLTLYQGGRAKTFRERPEDAACREAEVRAVRAIVKEMQDQATTIPKGSALRDWLSGWSKRLAEWADEGACEPDKSGPRRSVAGETTAAPADDSRKRRRAERFTVWAETPRQKREDTLLAVLADAQLTIRETAIEMSCQLGLSTNRGEALDTYELTPLIKRMFGTGQLQRRAELFKGKTRYRYTAGDGSPEAA